MIKSIHMTSTGGVCECGRVIKYVWHATLADGSVMTYGSECIRKMVAPDGLKLLTKRMKQLETYVDYRDCLAMEHPPRGSSYFNSGLFMIADSSGKDIFIDETLVTWGKKGSSHWVFHPDFAEAHEDSPYAHGNDGREEKFRKGFELARAQVNTAIENLQKSIAFLTRKYAKANQTAPATAQA